MGVRDDLAVLAAQDLVHKDAPRPEEVGDGTNGTTLPSLMLEAPK